jgi:hypothetical protein
MTNHSALNLNVHLHSLVLEGSSLAPWLPRHRCFIRCPRRRTKTSPNCSSRSTTACWASCAAAGACPKTPVPPIPWLSSSRSWLVMPPPPSRSESPAVRGPVTRSAGCAPRPPSSTNRSRAVLGLEGFSLHANVAVAPRARDQLEHLCRYLLRPPLTLERLTETSHGQLLYELPHPRGVATQCPSSLYR